MEFGPARLSREAIIAVKGGRDLKAEGLNLIFLVAHLKPDVAARAPESVSQGFNLKIDVPGRLRLRSQGGSHCDEKNDGSNERSERTHDNQRRTVRREMNGIAQVGDLSIEYLNL
ncbi:MAG: hypothetical protein BRD55_07985 [Bacteroidetes bacterium SW_9_63_38]|nr:MAG: hypothetical protein BRD55_07985 [Bacteroidetes bacterium SW_9_63_38]